MSQVDEMNRKLVERTSELLESNKPSGFQWAKGYVFCTRDGKFYKNGKAMSKDSFNTKYKRHHITDKKYANVAEYLIGNDIILCVDNVMYNPSKGHVFKLDGTMYGNTFNTESFPVPSNKNYDLVKDAILTHIGDLYKSKPHHAKMFLDWMAYQVQNPGKKITWAYAKIGLHGTGKDTAVDIFGTAIGSVNVNIVKQSDLKSGFNDYAGNAQLAKFGEAKHITASQINSIKENISNERISLNGKYLPANPNAVNVTNYIFMSNYYSCLQFSINERRFYVAYCDNDKKPKNYFDNLKNLINSNAGTVRQVLLDHNVSEDFSPYSVVKTDEFYNMCAGAKSDAEGLVRQAIEECNHIGVRDDVVCLRALTDYLDEKNITYKRKVVQYGLEDLGFVYYGKDRQVIGEVKQDVYKKLELKNSEVKKIISNINESLKPKESDFSTI